LFLKTNEKEPTKNRFHENRTIISNVFIAKHFYKKDDVQ